MMMTIIWHKLKAFESLYLETDFKSIVLHLAPFFELDSLLNGLIVFL